MKKIIGLSTIVALIALSLVTASCGRATPEADSQKHLLDYPLVRQSTDYTCGVAGLMSVLRYYGFQVREDTLASELGTDQELGTDYRRIIEAARARGIQADPQAEMSPDVLETHIDGRQPVMCCIQAWGDPADYTGDDNGHWVVAIGYDDENLYFMDPSTLGNVTFITRDELVERWHDSTADAELIRFGIIFDGQPDYNPDATFKLE